MASSGKNSSDPLPSPEGEEFPETRTEILAEAKDGNWTQFLALYLKPCWREVMLACRARHLPVLEPEELYQELMVRLFREAPFAPAIREELASQGHDPGFRANLPGRYLEYRKTFQRSARFRTYLKRAIGNLVVEFLRRKQRDPRPVGEETFEGIEPWIEESISVSLDRRWAVDCLEEAARQLRVESDRARTRAERRLFGILCLATVEGMSPEQIADHYQLNRSTISPLLKKARARFVELLQEATGCDLPELRGLLGRHVEDLKRTLSRVRKESP